MQSILGRDRQFDGSPSSPLCRRALALRRNFNPVGSRRRDWSPKARPSATWSGPGPRSPRPPDSSRWPSNSGRMGHPSRKSGTTARRSATPFPVGVRSMTPRSRRGKPPWWRMPPESRFTAGAAFTRSSRVAQRRRSLFDVLSSGRAVAVGIQCKFTEPVRPLKRDRAWVQHLLQPGPLPQRTPRAPQDG